MTDKQFIKLVEEMLFMNYQTTLSIGDTKYFVSIHIKHYADGINEEDVYSVTVNRKAIKELCGGEE